MVQVSNHTHPRGKSKGQGTHVKEMHARLPQPYQLLRLGKIYGADSVAFRRYLRSQILDDGRHLELMFWIEEQQRLIPKEKKTSAAEFGRALNAALHQAGVIPNVPQGAKTSFLRDEPKLWNKLRLLVPYRGGYFHPKEGYIFNWREIIAMLSS